VYDPTKPYKGKVIDRIKTTWETPYVSVKNSVVCKRFSLPEFHHCDAIGTKGLYHWQARTFSFAVQDALAMNFNDLLLARAQAYAVIDHITLPAEDVRAIEAILHELVLQCRRREIAVTGGETAIHDTQEGLEISITMLGMVLDTRPNKYRVGDVLVGIGSSGPHSNGFTKIREVFGKEFRPEFVTPTFIYSDTILPLMKRVDVHGMTHITGGAFTKIKDYLPPSTDVVINGRHALSPQSIFWEIRDRKVSDREMYQTFNCGIGLVVGVAEKDVVAVLEHIRKKFPADVIGKVTKGTGRVNVTSWFSGQELVY